MQRRARVTRYNHLFARSIVTRRRGVGGVFLLWGKGFKKKINFLKKRHQALGCSL